MIVSLYTTIQRRLFEADAVRHASGRRASGNNVPGGRALDQRLVPPGQREFVNTATHVRETDRNNMTDSGTRLRH